jgi:hypothetical protein
LSNLNPNNSKQSKNFKSIQITLFIHATILINIIAISQHNWDIIDILIYFQQAFQASLSDEVIELSKTLTESSELFFGNQEGIYFTISSNLFSYKFA